jgi:hypothetical protein
MVHHLSVRKWLLPAKATDAVHRLTGRERTTIDRVSLCAPPAHSTPIVHVPRPVPRLALLALLGARPPMQIEGGESLSCCKNPTTAPLQIWRIYPAAARTVSCDYSYACFNLDAMRYTRREQYAPQRTTGPVLYGTSVCATQCLYCWKAPCTAREDARLDRQSVSNR